MQLAQYIETVGVQKMQDLHKVSKTTVYSWKNLDYVPDPAKAWEIIRKSHGVVTWAEIYDPYFENLSLAECRA